MSCRVASIVVAGSALAAGLVGGAGDGRAQDRLVLHPVPHAVEPWPDDAPVLIPPAVPGAAFGYSGYGYYYDGPGEGPLARYPEVRRTSAGRGGR